MNIPTAEELLTTYYNNDPTTLGVIQRAMIEFAKLHVQACKEEIVKNAKVKIETYSHPDESEWSHVIDKDSILNSYIDKIK